MVPELTEGSNTRIEYPTENDGMIFEYLIDAHVTEDFTEILAVYEQQESGEWKEVNFEAVFTNEQRVDILDELKEELDFILDDMLYAPTRAKIHSGPKYFDDDFDD